MLKAVKALALRFWHCWDLQHAGRLQSLVQRGNLAVPGNGIVFYTHLAVTFAISGVAVRCTALALLPEHAQTDSVLVIIVISKSMA